MIDRLFCCLLLAALAGGCSSSADDGPAPPPGSGGSWGTDSKGPSNPDHRGRFVGLYGGVTDEVPFYCVYYQFTTEGRFWTGAPRFASDGTPDFDASVATRPAFAGHFRVEGDELVLRYDDDGFTVQFPVYTTPRGEVAFKRFGEQFEPVSPSPVTKLASSFRSDYSASAGSNGTTMVTVFKNVKLDFTADGRFSYDRESILSVVATLHHATPADAAVQLPADPMAILVDINATDGVGTYRVHGLQLRLTFADGHAVEDVFLPIISSGMKDPNRNGFCFGPDLYLPR